MAKNEIGRATDMNTYTFYLVVLHFMGKGIVLTLRINLKLVNIITISNQAIQRFYMKRLSYDV